MSNTALNLMDDGTSNQGSSISNSNNFQRHAIHIRSLIVLERLDRSRHLTWRMVAFKAAVLGPRKSGKKGGHQQNHHVWVNPEASQSDPPICPNLLMASLRSCLFA